MEPGEGEGLEGALAEEVGLIGVVMATERARQARKRREHPGVGSRREHPGVLVNEVGEGRTGDEVGEAMATRLRAIGRARMAWAWRFVWIAHRRGRTCAAASVRRTTLVGWWWCLPVWYLPARTLAVLFAVTPFRDPDRIHVPLPARLVVICHGFMCTRIHPKQSIHVFTPDIGLGLIRHLFGF